MSAARRSDPAPPGIGRSTARHLGAAGARCLATLALLAAGTTLAAPAGGAVAAASMPATALHATDDSGHRIDLARPARRIVTLAPHLAELVFAAGAGDRLVGVSRYSDEPAAAASRPVVGDAFAVDAELLTRLAPDLVLAWGSGTSERTKSHLRALGFTVYDVEIRSVAGLAETLRRIGDFAGTPEAAQAHAAALERDWDALRAQYAKRSPVRVFYQLWDAPLMTLGERHIISQAIAACGGRNVFADLPTLTAAVSWEAAVRRDPQIVITAGSPSEAVRPGRWTEFPALSATRAGAFVQLDGDLIARSGPRFVQGTRQMCEAIDRVRLLPK